jgi:hypothetical protein
MLSNDAGSGLPTSTPVQSVDVSQYKVVDSSESFLPEIQFN